MLALTHLDGTRELVVVGLPGDREVDLKRVEVAFAPAEVEAATEADFAGNDSLVKGYIGPWSPQGPSSARSRPAASGTSSTRASSTGPSGSPARTRTRSTCSGSSPGATSCRTASSRLAEVRDGDPAPDGSGPIQTARGMEIGHVFQLGRKYAEALGLKVLDENGKLVTVTMGSYGIGVTRILAVIAESNNDDKGLIWPENVAPFDVHVIATGKDEVVYELGRATHGRARAQPVSTCSSTTGPRCRPA